MELDKDAALELVASCIKNANRAGFDNAAKAMQLWRLGGDDLQGSKRNEKQWTDAVTGEKKSGFRFPSTLFWPENKNRLIAHLDAHRTRLIAGAEKRIKDGRLKGLNWKAPIACNDGVGNLFWNFSSDIQWTLGGCTVNSVVTVGVTQVTRAGAVIDFRQNIFVPAKGDRFDLAFLSWQLYLSDIYQWVHGAKEKGGAGAPADMFAADLAYFVTHGHWKNPQEMLHQMETWYALDPKTRVFARPYDVVTDPVFLKSEDGLTEVDAESPTASFSVTL